MSDPVMRGVELPDSELLKKFDVPAPRYTSYPTADRFNDGFTAKDYEAELAGRKDANSRRKGSGNRTKKARTNYAVLGLLAVLLAVGLLLRWFGMKG